MSGIRLVAAEEGAPFPWEQAVARLRSIPGVQLLPKDFSRMIAVGRRIGWTDEMIEANEGLARRGKCFEIEQSASPYLTGSLFEDNILFSFSDLDHQKACEPVVEALAQDLGVVLRAI